MDLKSFSSANRIPQRELAELFSCAPAHVSNIVNGKRSLTALQVRLLIERYGLEAVAKYADPSELPASAAPVVSVDLSKGKTEISGNQAPVNNGSGTQNVGGDSSLVDALKAQATVLSNQSDQISKLLDQQARLIALLENQNKAQ